VTVTEPLHLKLVSDFKYLITFLSKNKSAISSNSLHFFLKTSHVVNFFSNIKILASHLLESYLGTVTTLLDLQSNGVIVPLRNWLLFVVNTNYFVTFKISVTSNCNSAVTIKNG
jgi:hypothetical protein